MNTATAAPYQPMQVKNKALLAILSVTPLAVLLVTVDLLFLKGQIRAYMNIDSMDILFWAAVLTVPHIVASLLTFADREYLTHYKGTIAKGLVIATLLGVAVPVFMGETALLIAMAFYTMYHNLMQQYGISLMMSRQPSTFDYQAWRWLTIIPAGLAYTALLGPQYPFVAHNFHIILGSIGLCLIIATFFGVRLIGTILKNPNHTRIGLVYLIGNMAMLYVCFGLILLGYAFLATLIPRLIHDLTAFWIYMVHDQNRNAVKTHNPIYALPKKIGLKPIWVCVPVALAISYVLMDTLGNVYAVILFTTVLNFMHYYMESYMWKRGTPHRASVPFS